MTEPTNVTFLSAQPRPKKLPAQQRTQGELEALDDAAYAEALTADVKYAKAHSSPFQSEALITRTENALVDALWQVDIHIQQQAEDPSCPPERYKRSQNFRLLILSAIDITERRRDYYSANKGAANALRAWRAFAHELADIIEDGADAYELDEVEIPFGGLTARQWLEVRRVKDPSRIREDVAA
jgi:hypothetical protein